jgi:hypothetical protein
MARAQFTYIENWPSPLYDLSIPHIDLPLNQDEARALGSNIRHFGHWFGSGPAKPLDRIAQRLAAALDAFPGGAFVRLGSRSGKDSDFAQACGMRVTSLRGALLMLTDGSERIALDLRCALYLGYEPHIFVREWREIPNWAEFRCFMQDRRLIGISQYDCINLRHVPEIAGQAHGINAAIESFFQEFRQHVHVADVVFDVYLQPGARNDQRSFDVRLLEMNPFCTKTDACLFRWSPADSAAGDFDGSFRYLDEADKIARYF